MVVAERDERRHLAVQGAIALDLVLIAAGMAVEKVAVVDPNVLVVLLQADVVAFVRIDIHDAQVADFHILSILDADAPAVYRSIVTDTFHRHVGRFGLAEINHHVALHKRIRIRHIANEAQVERSRLVALLVAIQDALEALASILCALGIHGHIHRHRIFGALGNINYGGSVLKRTVSLVGTRNTAIAERKTSSVMSFDRQRFRGCRSGFLAAFYRRDLERVATGLEANHVHTVLGTVFTDELGIHFNIVCTSARIIDVVAIGTIRCPFGIGRF